MSGARCSVIRLSGLQTDTTAVSALQSVFSGRALAHWLVEVVTQAYVAAGGDPPSGISAPSRRALSSPQRNDS